MNEQTYQELVGQLKRISGHLEEIKLDNRGSRRVEEQFRRELVDAIGLVQLTVGR